MKDNGSMVIASGYRMELESWRCTPHPYGIGERGKQVPSMNLFARSGTRASTLWTSM